MQTDRNSAWDHDHVFDTGNPAAERGTRLVMWITASMMVIEIAAGWWYNSMALLADGWHMSSHAVAIGLSAIAYSSARRYSKDPRFAFGTWKIEVLGGFASAIILLGIVATIVVSSVERFITPQPIHYQEAIVVAVLGLVVNIVCALILGKAHHHDHTHEAHHDLNLKSAYVHVLADSATSVLAIIALCGGLFYGWAWLDPVMGIVSAIVVAIWAGGLVAQTGKVLLDREMDHPVVDEIRSVIEAGAGGTRVTDLHVWRVGKNVYSCALTVSTNDPSLTPAAIRARLRVHEEIVHSTIEVHHRSAS
jgi:cation diffusion facilitator family transporter